MSLTQGHVSIVENFAVPPERIWAAITDHATMGEWMDTRITVLRGPDDGGVGTVRRLHIGGLRIDEQVVYADAPRRLVYQIVAGMPLLRFHRGEILVEPWGETGSQISWDIVMDLAVPGLGKALVGAVGKGVRKGLGTLRSTL